ncbi:MAG TPA: hypothetical protein DCE41_29825 [Cytophagales bacterium]|nr:hypothetical protein [Cytophagales bacterium]HAA19179.1 hypothetical protein [Cytophagales bacterium]HAP58868.1 hypothetical protein [Cytophagales bacterium]
MKKLLVGAFVALMTFAACQPEEVVPMAVNSATDASLIVTSAEEVETMLVRTMGTADISLEEKLDFLSEHYARQVTEKIQGANRGASADVYVAVAQVFDGFNFYTDVDTGDGTSILLAQEVQTRLEFLSFTGCNANVYKNGSNIGGNITNEVNFECPGQKIRLFAYARWAPNAAEVNGDVNTIVNIRCDGPIVPEIQFP